MILVAGSANLDFVVQAAHIPTPGETVLGRQFSTFPGGKGANQAVACARAGGAATHMLLALGEDPYAQPLKASLDDASVVMHTVPVADQATGVAFICVGDDGENAITVAPGANAALKPAHLPPLKGFTHLLMQLEIPLPTVTHYAQQARAQGLTVVLNAAPAQALPDDLLAVVDVLIVNQAELQTVAQHWGSIADGLRQLSTPTVVVTLGARGCCARQGATFYVQPSLPVQAVDTTGAGDTFCGALVAALSQGSELSQALRRATVAAALACTRLGAQTSIPSAAEVASALANLDQTNAEERAHGAASARAEEQTLRAFCGL